MIIEKSKNEFQFLEGGGEMGELIRTKDWNKTIVGRPDTWPQSLKTTISIILSSKFPMFLFWGPDLICFYNDAYRPSLGKEGKHPNILGSRGEDFWQEIWSDIKPLIDRVLGGGEATWSEDQLLPIYRNGKLEDVYWTFSYSPVKDESGKPAGVFVTCNETTDKVNAYKRLEESNKRYFENIMQAPVAMCILRGNEFVVEIANRFMLEIWGKSAKEVMNKPIFEGLPEAKGQGIETLLENVFLTGEGFEANEMPIDLPRNGKIETTYINFVYEALKDSYGNISGIVAIANEVTHQVLSHKKIEENEEKLNIVIEASELGIWELNLATKEPSYSRRYLKIIGGYDDDVKLTHAELLQHLHPDDLPLREAAFQEAFRTGHLYYTSRLIWKDKSIHWMEGKGKVFYDKDNKPLKLIGTIRDITEEKSHQQVLTDSEQKFRFLADSLPLHIWTSNLEGKINYFNKSVYEFCGFTLEQINSVNWTDFIHPADRDYNIKLWEEAIKEGKEFLIEHRIRRYDGIYRWHLTSTIPQKNDKGEIQMWVGTSTDIEAQKQFLKELERQVSERTLELKKSEERYHLMVEEVQDYAILYINKEGIIENWNKGAEKIKGYKPEEIIGKSFSNFYTESDQKSNLPQQLLNEAQKTGKAVQQGWRVRKDGSQFWASVVITAVHNETGEVIGFSKVTHDLTEKKEADDKLKASSELLQQNNTELEKMNKELQSFAYISSHDLQEPLRKIQTFASLILDKEYDTLSERGKDSFKRMQNAAARMQTLIKDLLAYSRTSTTERNFETVNLNEILEDVKEDLNEEIQQKHAIIEATQMCDVTIIPFQFRQLLYNLLSNALKFSKEKEHPYIKIKSRVEKGKNLNNKELENNLKYCHITIADNGIGFDPQYKEKIFEVFQRLDSKNRFNGTGIGLAIVKKIVDNHDGLIIANGELNEGATFDIYIPQNN